MSVKYFDIKKLRQDLGLFDQAMYKLAFTPQGPPPPPMTAAPPMDPNAMPPGGAPPMGPDGQPMDPNAMPPMGPDGQPMPMDPSGQHADPNAMPPGAMPPGGVDPQLEGMLSELANGVTGMGNEVQSQRDQINQLTQRLLLMEQQMSSFQEGLKAPAPMEQAEEQAPIPGKPL